MKNYKDLILNQLREQREKLVVAKNWPGVLLVLNRMIELDPSSKRFCSRAEMLRKLGCFLEAKESYEDALILNPKYVKAYKGLEKITDKLQEINNTLPSQIKDNYQKLQQYNWTEPIRSQIVASIIKEDWCTALELCQEWVLTESTPLRFCMEAAMYIQNNMWQKAIVSYDKALQKDSQFRIATRGIERIKDILQEQKKYELKVITLDPEPEDQLKETFDDSMYIGIVDNKDKDPDDSSGEMII